MNITRNLIGFSLIITGGFAFNNYRERANVVRNLEQLKWMDEHTFQSPKTTTEINLIARSIKEQEHWLYSWNIFKFSPHIEWAELPMDRDFLDKFH